MIRSNLSETIEYTKKQLSSALASESETPLGILSRDVIYTLDTIGDSFDDNVDLNNVIVKITRDIRRVLPELLYTDAPIEFQQISHIHELLKQCPYQKISPSDIFDTRRGAPLFDSIMSLRDIKASENFGLANLLEFLGCMVLVSDLVKSPRQSVYGGIDKKAIIGWVKILAIITAALGSISFLPAISMNFAEENNTSPRITSLIGVWAFIIQFVLLAFADNVTGDRVKNMASAYVTQKTSSLAEAVTNAAKLKATELVPSVSSVSSSVAKGLLSKAASGIKRVYTTLMDTTEVKLADAEVEAKKVKKIEAALKVAQAERNLDLAENNFHREDLNVKELNKNRNPGSQESAEFLRASARKAEADAKWKEAEDELAATRAQRDKIEAERKLAEQNLAKAREQEVADATDIRLRKDRAARCVSITAELEAAYKELVRVPHLSRQSADGIKTILDKARTALQSEPYDWYSNNAEGDCITAKLALEKADKAYGELESDLECATAIELANDMRDVARRCTDPNTPCDKEAIQNGIKKAQAVLYKNTSWWAAERRSDLIQRLKLAIGEAQAAYDTSNRAGPSLLGQFMSMIPGLGGVRAYTGGASIELTPVAVMLAILIALCIVVLYVIYQDRVAKIEQSRRKYIINI